MTTAILGGLGAAAAWAISTVCSSRSTRLIDPLSVLAWVMLVGFVLAVPLALARGIPAALGGSAGLWLALAGGGNVAGLLLAYAALRVGRVGLLAPLLSTEGALAALIAILAGESIAPGVGVTLVVIAAGVVAAAMPGGSSPAHLEYRHARSIVLGLCAVLAWGSSLYAAGRAGAHLPSAWVAAAARLIGVPVITLPLALSGRLRLIRPAAGLVVATGVAEVLGFYAYATGARHGIAVAAVLASQFGTLAALIGFVALRERLSRVQAAGVLVTVVGVAVLSALQA